MPTRVVGLLIRDAKQLARAVLSAHVGYIPGSDGAPCGCKDCVTARRILGDDDGTSAP